LKKVEVKFTGTNIKFRVWIDDDLLDFTASVANKQVMENTEYALSWMIIGNPGSKWALEMPKPDKYKWRNPASRKWRTTKIKRSETLKETKDAGLKWFIVT